MVFLVSVQQQKAKFPVTLSDPLYICRSPSTNPREDDPKTTVKEDNNNHASSDDQGYDLRDGILGDDDYASGLDEYNDEDYVPPNEEKGPADAVEEDGNTLTLTLTLNPKS
jgi:hypothetical protein